MAKTHETWTVLEHGPLEQLADNLWRVEGTLPGMALCRHMLVARDAEGKLLIHNGIALDPPTLEALEALGTPTWLIVPNRWHRLDAPAYKQRFPALRVYCPAGARAAVEQVVSVDGTYETFPHNPAWSVRYVDGIAQREGVWTLHSGDGATLVFNDLVFNQPHMPGWFGTLYKWLGQSGKPRVTLIGKLAVVKEKRACRADLERLADTPDLLRIIPGHGKPVLDDAPATLRRIAASL